MPEVHFEIIGLEDIGKDVIKPSSSSSSSSKPSHHYHYHHHHHHHHRHHQSTQKLSDADVENLKHYLQRHNQASSKKTTTEKKSNQPLVSVDISNPSVHSVGHHSNYVDITNDFYTAKEYSALNASIEQSQPLTDVYRYHHHYHRHQPHTKHAHEKVNTFVVALQHEPAYSLEWATCGMKKNTRLPVPHENFSLTNGCFGDDAGFTLERDQHNFLGISDGAGGNVMYGFNPRLFSESLMRNCSDLANTGKYTTTEPKRLLCHAFDRVQDENCFGSATACVVGVDSQSGQLHSVNIGDSGYVIVRHGSVTYRSKSQKMNGDCPRQLDVYPWTASLKKKGLNYTQISSVDAICQSFQLEQDDIIILSTDGLFDNVPHRLIERILASSKSLKHAANELVNHAVRYYVKPDDILVIMARLGLNQKKTNGEQK